MTIPFSKYHALGNDYLVIKKTSEAMSFTPNQIELLCHRHYGIGSDGILLVSVDHNSPKPYSVQIFNPDGSEAEKSGNGLRILSRYLWDFEGLRETPFEIQTLGGKVTCQVSQQGNWVQVEMGKATFKRHDIPVESNDEEVLEDVLTVDSKTFTFSAVSVGNPHCVILTSHASPEEAKKYGPKIETLSIFPHRTNVQWAEVIDRRNIRIEIWERGAGYTLASGSSSCAVASVVHRLGLCDSEVTVHMPGGALQIKIDLTHGLTMSGPVRAVYHAQFSHDLLQSLSCVQ